MSIVKKPQSKAENPSVVLQSEQSLWNKVCPRCCSVWSSPVLPELVQSQPLEVFPCYPFPGFSCGSGDAGPGGTEGFW